MAPNKFKDSADLREWLYTQSEDSVVAYIMQLRELATQLFLLVSPESLTDDITSWFTTVMYEVVDGVVNAD